ncbi:NAD kinase [Acetobacteraceae bacterium]|nr:NAD kinase [Acetobacteraceae bacterium]
MLKIAFLHSKTLKANKATKALLQVYGNYSLEEADLVVCLGGDGFLLECLHRIFPRQIPVYGINYGTVGFLLNTPLNRPEELEKRLLTAQPVKISPLRMDVLKQDGTKKQALGFNDIFIFRQSHQTICTRIEVDGRTRLLDLKSDGIILSTPAGSTAYNNSVRGPIVPLDANILPLTPIAPSNPRHWGGALLPMTSSVRFILSHTEKRPAAAVADSREIRDVVEVSAKMDTSYVATLLFDPEFSLSEKMVQQQFSG